jgi:orotate phosphoribosyltransferase
MLDELLALLGGRSGHFTFESGHHGNRWFDLELLFHRPRAVQPLVDELARRVSAHQFDAVCGPLIEGAFVAQLVAAQLDVPFSYTEPTMQQGAAALYPVTYRIPAALRPKLHGKSVAIINDVINAGSAVGGTHADLVACGAKPVAIGTLLVLGTWTHRFAAEHNLALETLSTLQNEIWTPAECPMCAAGQPLDGGYGIDTNAARPAES